MLPMRRLGLRFETLEERRLLSINTSANYEPADIRQLAAMFAPQSSFATNVTLSQALDSFVPTAEFDLASARDAQRSFYGIEGDRLFASVVGNGTREDLLATIVAVDGDVQYVSADSPLVDAFIPLENLYELFDTTNISSITPINIAEQTNSVGSVSNAAENVLRGSTLSSFRGLTGAGINIGVISNGVGGLSTSQSTGDLPANVTVLNAGSGSEGTAMMELIHDIAPNAHLIFSSGSGSEFAFRDAVNNLVTAGANIIVDDLSGLITESFFADGPAAIAINNAVASGVTYFSSAGNRGDDGFETATHFVSSQNVYGQIGTFHDFSGTGDFLQTVSSTNFGTFQLQFDQLFNAVSSDVKLLIFNNSGTLLSSSTQVNSAALVQNPNDSITSLTNFSGTVQLAIQLVSGSTPSRMKWFNSRNINTIEYDTLAGNLRTGRDSGHAAAVSNISVGASDFANPFVTRTYSGIGQVTRSLTPAGAAMPVAFRGGPTLMGVDGTNTSVNQDQDYRVFTGTSAAAPNVAAIAALLLEANPWMTPQDVRAALIDSARDMDAPGVDLTSGAGLIDALGALGKTDGIPQLVGLNENQFTVIAAANDALSGGTLRQAIVAANTPSETHTTILVPANSYALTLTGSGSATQGDLDITRSMSIIGAGAGRAIVNASALRGANADRVFEVTNNATFNLIGVTVTGGEPNTNTLSVSGGGILVRNDATLNLRNSAIVGNYTPNDGGGGVYFEYTAGGSIINSVITNNSATGSGGGIALQYPQSPPPGTSPGTVTIANSIVAKNFASGDGKDIKSDFDTRVFTSLGNNLLTSIPTTMGPGQYAGFANGVKGDRVDSLVDNVVTDVSDSIVANNGIALSLREAIQAGGRIWAPGWRFEMTIGGAGGTNQGDFDIGSFTSIRGVGAGQTIVDASPLRATAPDRVFDVLNGAILNLNGVTVTGGRPTGVNFVGGGGIVVRDGGTLNLSNSAIVGNSTPNGGGGGLYFELTGSGFITNSVITKNAANSTSGYGGGIELYYPSQTAGTPYGGVSVANSIIANNTAGPGDGADIKGDYENRVFTSLGNNLLTTIPTTPGLGLGAGFANGANGDRVTYSAGYVVTDVADTLNATNNSAVLSLREAIQTANTNGGEIWAPGWRFEMSIAGSSGVTEGDFDINHSMTLRGIGAGETVIDASALTSPDRVFDVDIAFGTFTLDTVTVTGGKTNIGGGIIVQNNATLILSNSAIVRNTTTNGGAGIYFTQMGGGTITTSVIAYNDANSGYGGGIELQHPGTSGASVAQVSMGTSIIANNLGAAGAKDLQGDYDMRPVTTLGNNRLTTVPATNSGFSHNVSNDWVNQPVSYVVTAIADNFHVGGDPVAMSLRDVVDRTNSDPFPQEIWLPAWKFFLTRERPQLTPPLPYAPEIDVAIGDIEVKDSLTIRGIRSSPLNVLTSVAWRAGAPADKVFELYGDYDSSLTVDSSDYIQYRKQQGQTGNGLAADGNEDGLVDNLDQTIYNNSFGNTLTKWDILA